MRLWLPITYSEALFGEMGFPPIGKEAGINVDDWDSSILIRSRFPSPMVGARPEHILQGSVPEWYMLNFYSW